MGPQEMLLRIWQENLAVFRSIVRNILFDQSLVEDVLQESFKRLLQRNRRFSSEQEAYNYLRKVVVNTTIDHYRNLTRRNGSLPLRRQVVEEREGPLDRLIQAEESRLHTSLLNEVRRALRVLSPEQREAIEVFFHRDGRRMKQVCRELGVPYSTLRSRMMAGVEQIRRHLKTRGLLSPEAERRGK